MFIQSVDGINFGSFVVLSMLKLVLLFFLKRSVEANKQASCSIHLTNRTDHHIAIKVTWDYYVFGFHRAFFVCLRTQDLRATAFQSGHQRI
jgi:hypothetical protein